MIKEIQRVKEVKELTSKPFGINILSSGQNPDVQLELMLKVLYKEKVQVSVVAFDSKEVPEEVIKDLKAHGVIVVYHPISITPDIAKKAEKAGTDIYFVIPTKFIKIV